MQAFDSLTSIVCVISILIISGVIMGHMAFTAGMGVKRWAFLGFLIGPVAYPLLNTHKRYAWRRSVGQSIYTIRF